MERVSQPGWQGPFGPLAVLSVAPVILQFSGCAGGFQGYLPVAPTVSQPGSVTVPIGQRAAFTVTATGTGNVTFQWYKNGVPISGATSSSYTTPPTTAGDNGAVYTVTVTNSAGTVTSGPATLTVQLPPPRPLFLARQLRLTTPP